MRGSPSTVRWTDLSAATKAVVPPARKATTRAWGTMRRQLSRAAGPGRRGGGEYGDDRRDERGEGESSLHRSVLSG
ncbi:hypothetical protein AB0O29_20770, partial [Streptomyces sp. NPDC089915]